MVKTFLFDFYKIFCIFIAHYKIQYPGKIVSLLLFFFLAPKGHLTCKLIPGLFRVLKFPKASNRDTVPIQDRYRMDTGCIFPKGFKLGGQLDFIVPQLFGRGGRENLLGFILFDKILTPIFAGVFLLTK